MAKRSSFKFLKQNETRNFCNYSYNNGKKKKPILYDSESGDNPGSKEYI